MKKHKQFSFILIVQLEVDTPWVDHKKKTKKGPSINLLGLSQSSEESLPPRRHTTKRGGEKVGEEVVTREKVMGEEGGRR